MKKIRLYCASCLIALPMLACVVKTDGIKQIAKPYEGTYKAERIIWGEEDIMPLVKDLKLSLSDGGKLLLTYKQGLKTQSQEFRYKVEDGKLYIGEKEGGKDNWKEMQYEKGKICLTIPLAGKTLHALFTR